MFMSMSSIGFHNNCETGSAKGIDERSFPGNAGALACKVAVITASTVGKPTRRITIGCSRFTLSRRGCPRSRRSVPELLGVDTFP